ncbi:MAG: DUF6719 family protein [Betaproteobacteria bacterium]
MKSTNFSVATVVAIVGLLPYLCEVNAEILKEEPPKGSIPYGKVVYVDDGTCPLGEVKEITGGDQRRGVPRQVRCVKRPE